MFFFEREQNICNKKLPEINGWRWLKWSQNNKGMEGEKCRFAQIHLLITLTINRERSYQLKSGKRKNHWRETIEFAEFRNPYPCVYKDRTTPVKWRLFQTQPFKTSLYWVITKLEVTTNSCYYTWACRQIFFCLEVHADEANGSIQWKITNSLVRPSIKTADSCSISH